MIKIRKTYLERTTFKMSIFWFLLSLFVSACNDLIAKILVTTIGSFEITFFRFFFSILFLIPFIIRDGISTLKSNNIIVHLIRGILLFLAIVSWNWSLKILNLTTATVVSFTIPIFTLIFSFVFLKEKIHLVRWVLTIVVFIGLVILLNPYFLRFEFLVIVAFGSVIFFSILDIINKKLINVETNLNMMFFSSLFVTIISFFFALKFWTAPGLKDIILFIILGINANLILFFLLKAFSLSDLNVLAPYRYFEFVFSAILSSGIFHEVLDIYLIIGTCIIVPAVYLIYRLGKKI